MKKLLLGTGAATIVAALAFSIIASAQTTTSTTTSSMPSQPMVLQIGKEGQVLMRGTIDAVATGSLTVKSWGGDWIVNVSGNTQILPAAANGDLSQFKTGDFVGIQGTVSQSGVWTIDASLVRDWTYRQMVNQERRQNVQSVRETMQSETPRDYQGTASGISGTTFMLTAGNGTAYTVNVASDAKVLNRTWLTLSLSSIQSGDTVRVWGANASGTITAEVVRDISLPAAATSTH